MGLSHRSGGAKMCSLAPWERSFSPSSLSQSVVEIRFHTDCRSLYDHILAQGKLPDDRNEALYIAELRQLLQAGPSSDDSKANLQWVPSRCQLADGLTKPGLAKAMRETLRFATCKMHEVSQQSLVRAQKSRAQRA